MKGNFLSAYPRFLSDNKREMILNRWTEDFGFFYKNQSGSTDRDSSEAFWKDYLLELLPAIIHGKQLNSIDYLLDKYDKNNNLLYVDVGISGVASFYLLSCYYNGKVSTLNVPSVPISDSSIKLNL